MVQNIALHDNKIHTIFVTSFLSGVYRNLHLRGLQMAVNKYEILHL